MTPERWQLIKSILADALEQSPEERALFIGQRCAQDEELQQEVESFFAQSSEDYLENGSENRQLSDAVSSGNAPASDQRIGVYQLVAELGRGGMGSVWLARRADQRFEQQVAIKLLKRGIDTEEVLRRFQAERQILARLQHSGIARLLDGGETSAGLPYLVMELAEGQPITVFTLERRLTLAERLGLFRQACAAVSYAHRNLVIHRDLKPANVLVTAGGEVKLLDFGIARLIQGEDESLSAPTLTRQRLMTPEYASPEQLTGETVTTLSDVYSLGVLLYELLTGRRPYDLKTRSAGDFARAISGGEPERPSAVLMRGSAEKPVADYRQLRGDLDRIVLKALRTDPQRRYSSVDQFSDDLQNYLTGLPVLARPDTAGYRLSKFVLRHKTSAIATLLTVLTLLVGIVATAWQAQRANLEKKLAERRFSDVRRLAHAVLFDYGEQIAALPGSIKLRERLTRDALEYLDNLSQETGSDTSLLREVGTAYAKIGRVQGNSYYDNLGDLHGAMASYQKSLSIRQRLNAQLPGDVTARADLAESLEGVGDMEEILGHLDRAQASYQAARQLLVDLIKATPGNEATRVALAGLWLKIGNTTGMPGYPNLGDTAGALAAYREAEKLLNPLFATHPADPAIEAGLANTLGLIGYLSDILGDAPGGVANCRRALALASESAARIPENPTYKKNVATASFFFRYTLVDNGLLSEAIAQSRSTIDMLQKMSDADPENQQLLRNLEIATDNLGIDLLLAGDIANSLIFHKKALALVEILAKAAPDSEENRADLAFTLQKLAEAETAAGDAPSAIANLQKALSLQPTASGNASPNSQSSEDIAAIHANLGNAQIVLGNLPQAVKELDQGVALAHQLAIQTPENIRKQCSLALKCSQAGLAHQRFAEMNPSSPGFAAEWQAARQYYLQSQQIWENLRQTHRLFPLYAGKPAEMNQAIAVCDKAILP